MNGYEQPLEPKKISDICEEYRVKLTTLNEWIDLGVCQKVRHQFNNRGRTMWVLMPDQILRLERFLKYREWFVRKHNNDRPQVTEIIGLLEEIEAGNLEGAVSILTEIEQTLYDKHQEVQAEIQSLSAQVYEGVEINPEEVE